METGNSQKPIVVLACDVLQDMVEQSLPPELATQVTFFDFGLHAIPKKMQLTLQEAIDSITPASIVVLGYGLCGNGLKGIKAGPHTLVLPRVDDCVAVMLGSRQAYRQEFEKEPGTYYLARGWLERSRHRTHRDENALPAQNSYTADPLDTYQLYAQQYGEETAGWLMDQQYGNYRRLALVAPNAREMAQCRPRAQEIAAYCAQWNMRYEEIIGSNRYVRQLIQAAIALKTGNALPEDDDVLIILPGQEISQNQFL